MKLRILARNGELIHGKGYFHYGDEVEFSDEEALQRLEDYPHSYAKVEDVAPAPYKPTYLPKKEED